MTTYNGIKQGMVVDMRKIREQVSREIKDMTFEEERAYLDKLIADRKNSSTQALIAGNEAEK